MARHPGVRWVIAPLVLLGLAACGSASLPNASSGAPRPPDRQPAAITAVSPAPTVPLATLAPLLTPTPPPLPPAASVPPSRTPATPRPLARSLQCSDFPSQANAQNQLRSNPLDPYNLDPDRNGIACESNPAPFDRAPVPRR